MNIGNRLRFLRESRNLNPYTLSKRADIEQSHLDKIESGNVIPRIDTISRLARALNCNLAEFFNEDQEILYLTDDEKLLNSLYRQLLPEQKPLVIKAIENIVNASKGK